ncbi:MAG: Mov34/MPN/PAD-1 family protein [Deltaproteobacteria bacterium]|nr:Mov34/MPN/PAD-1 family protein [Deltaproteobacteria bacterium]
MSTRALVERYAAALAAHAAAWYPRECCALLFRDGAGVIELTLTDNLADHHHAADPEAFPRTATTAYVIDARLVVRAEREGKALVAIIHSHVDVGAYFSDEDLRQATFDDGGRLAPLYPGVDYVVLDVRQGQLVGFEVFGWVEERRGFLAR